jgi:hypothetical protein
MIREMIRDFGQKNLASVGGDPTDISQLASNSEQIVGEPNRRWKEIRAAVIRQPQFDNLAVVGSPFGGICCHSDTPLALIFTSISRSVVKDQCSTYLWQRKRPHEVAQTVGQGGKLQPNLVIAELAA